MLRSKQRHLCSNVDMPKPQVPTDSSERGELDTVALVILLASYLYKLGWAKG